MLHVYATDENLEDELVNQDFNHCFSLGIFIRSLFANKNYRFFLAENFFSSTIWVY